MADIPIVPRHFAHVIALLTFTLFGCAGTPKPAQGALDVAAREDPPTGVSKDLGPLRIEHGHGCGFLGLRGTRDGAIAAAKNKTAELGGNYYRIVKETAPYSDGECLHNEYILEGIAYLIGGTAESKGTATPPGTNGGHSTEAVAGVQPKAPTATAPVLVSPDPCKLQEVDFSNFDYPQSDALGEPFRMEKGSYSRDTGQKDTYWNLSMDRVQYGFLENSNQPDAFVFLSIQTFISIGYHPEQSRVLAFRMVDDCELKLLGSFELPLFETTFEGGAFVANKRPGRDEWRVQGGSLKRTLSTDRDPMAKQAPAWWSPDLSKMRGSLVPQLDEDAKLRALFQVRLGEKDYYEFYSRNLYSSSMYYYPGFLYGEGQNHISGFQRSAFVLTDDGELFCALVGYREEAKRIGPIGKPFPERLEQFIESVVQELSQED